MVKSTSRRIKSISKRPAGKAAPRKPAAPAPQNHPQCLRREGGLETDVRALIRAAERWRSVKVTEFERRQIAAVRKELDDEYEPAVGLNVQPSKGGAQAKISSNSQT